METASPDPDRRRRLPLIVIASILVIGLFFLGKKSGLMVSPIPAAQAKHDREVFGFAPHWTLDKLANVDWNVLSTFAYFSLPVNADGTIEHTSYEYGIFDNDKVASLFNKAREHNVRRVVTLTMMDAGSIEEFLSNEDAWKQLTQDSIDILKSKNLDGVNLDFEYIPSNDDLRNKFSSFVDQYSKELKKSLKNPYITVSVLASSVRFDKIYDVSHLAKTTDGVVMMAYDFYYPGSETIGPAAPLYGFNGGKGPFWYDVSTAVSDFLKVAPANKIIMGVPYYGWNYPAYDPKPKSDKVSWQVASPTTQEKANNDQLLETTPMGGWDDAAKVSWRGYWDDGGWHVVYMEDKKSLSYKYDFVKEKGLAGVGIWALGFDCCDDSLWATLREKFSDKRLATNI